MTQTRPTQTPTRSPVRGVALAIGVVALTAGVFWPTASHPFVNWDDPVNLADNTGLQGDLAARLRWAWSTTLLGVYQPVAWMVAALVYELQDGAHPRGYHVANVIIHALSAGVFCVLTARLLHFRPPSSAASAGGRAWPLAALAAVLFACHPLRVETVAWATAQPYALCVLFSLLAVLAYVSSHRPNRSAKSRRPLLGLALLFCALAMLSKAAAMALPVVLLVLDAHPLGRLSRPGRALAEKLPFFALSVGAGLLALWASGTVEAVRSVEGQGAMVRVAHAAYGLAFGVVKTMVPLNLSAYYALPRQTNPFEIRFLASAALVVSVTVAALAVRRRAPAVLAAWTCYVVLILPSVGIVSHGLQLAADRYTYLSCAGWPVLIAAGSYVATQTARSTIRALLYGLAVAAAGALISLTVAQNRHWAGSESLWRHAIACAPNDAFARKSLARELGAQGRHAESVEAYRRALQLDADHADAWSDLGYQLAAMHRLEDAVRCYQEALERTPNDAATRYNLGVALKSLGRLGEAAEQYALALRLRPDHPQTHNNLGNVYFAQGRFTDAERAYRAAVALDPDFPEPHNGLGLVALNAGAAEEAVLHFERALQLKPDYADAKRYLDVARQRVIERP